MIGTSYFINIEGFEVEVKIIRSTGRNLRMTFRDGKGRISIPKNAATSTVEPAKVTMNKWLRELAKKKAHLFAHSGPGALESVNITLMGITYDMTIRANDTNGKIRGRRKDGHILIELPSGIINDNAARQKYIPRLLSRIFAREIEERIHRINNMTIKGKIGRISLRSVTSRWGSCTAVNDIMLSNRLLLAPLEILDHVIIHELAHIVHKDHSIRFWRLVGAHDIDMKYHHNWLKIKGGSLIF